MYSTDLLDGVIDLRNITRITVVTDNEGRAFERFNAYDNGVVISIQDEGKTLKILPGLRFGRGENRSSDPTP